MASIFKRNKRKKGEPYWVQYTDENGKRRTQKGYTDRGLTEQLARRLEEEVRLRKTGMIDPEQEKFARSRKAPLEGHLTAFENSLKDNSPKYVRLTMTRVRTIVEGCIVSGSKDREVLSVRVAPFTLVGATTNPEGLIPPLIDRFRIVLHLDYFTENELAQIVRQRCHALGWACEAELLHEIAQRARQTPRIALRLLQSARRVSVAEGAESITVAHLTRACEIERISDLGLDHMQQKYVRLLADGPNRLNVLASMLGVSTKTVTTTIEPFLLRSGVVVKTDSGLRQLTETGRDHLAELRPLTV